MRLLAFYACVYLGALGALSAANLGWRSPFVSVWDIRTPLYIAGMCLLLVMVATAGIGGTTPVGRLPARWRTALISLIFSAGGFGILAAGSLSPASTAGEIATTLVKYLGSGIVVGVVAGSEGFWPRSGNDQASEREKPTNHVALVSMLIAVTAGGLALLHQPRQRETAKFEELARVEDNAGHLTMGVASSWPEEKFGYVSLSSHGASNILVLEGQEWREFKGLWSKAESSKSPTWRVVGDMHDTNPSDPTRLTVSAGPGLRLVMSSRHGPTITRQLAPSELERFDKAVALVEAALPD